MKKSFIFLFALVMTLGAWAQKDITATYVTNGGLTDFNGWTKTGFGDGIKGQNLSGKAAEAYAGWGALDLNSYSLTQQITLPKGKYRLVASAFFRQGLNYNTDKNKSLAYLIAGSHKVALKTLGSETAIAYANTQAEAAGVLSAGMYVNTLDFEVAEGGETMTIGYEGTFDLKQSWCLVSGVTLYDMEEDPAGLDYTTRLVNPSFENGTTGWTVTGSWGEQSNGEAVKVGTRYVEKWQATGGLPDGKISQKVTGLPNGKYRVTATAIQTGTNTYVYANNVKVQAPNPAAVVTLENIQVTDGTLEVGYSRESTTSNWVGVDNFRIYCEELNLDELIASHAAIVTEATEYVNSKQSLAYAGISESLSALSAAISAATLSESPSIREINTKSEALSNALSTAKTVIGNIEALYANAPVALAAQEDLMISTNIYDAEGFAAYKAKYEELKGKYENNTLTNEDGLVNPTAATGWHGTTEYNFLLTPWTIGGEACNEFDKALYINTWSEEGNTDGTNFYTPFFEYWVADGESLGNNTIASSVSGLENGLYSISAWVRVRAKNGVAATEATGITLTAGDGTYTGTEGNGVIDVTEGAQIGESQFTIAEYKAYALVKEGKLSFQFEVKDANISWLAFKNVKYAKVRDLTPEEQIVYATAEEIAALNAAIEAAEAKSLGFQEGEYAPYNNKEVLKALAAAKALDTVNPIDVEIVNAAIAAIADENWVANTEEVNAIENGDFEGDYSVLANSGVSADRAIYVPEGWTVTYTNGETNDMTCLNSTTMQWNQFKDLPQPENGESNTYWERFRWGANESLVLSQKINLLAGKYTLTADAYINGNTATAKVSVAGKEVTVNQTSWNNYKIDFDLENAEEVTVAFSFVQGGAQADSRVGFDNFVLMTAKTVPVVMAVNADAKYGTFCAPFDVDVTGLNVIASKVVAVNNNGLIVLDDIEEDVIPANTPVILYAEDGLEPQIFEGEAVEGEQESNILKGVYELQFAPAGSYVMQMNDGKVGFYWVKEAETISVPANRCYMIKPAGVEVREAYFFDIEDETGVESVEAKAAGLADGKYLINGKIVVVKAGKAYNLTGAAK